MIDININKNGPLPAYYQIQKQIREKIENEEIALGAQLPSERKLSKKLEVSRDTIRKAINNLIDEGYCTKKVGKGIFVSTEKIPFNITNLKGTTKYIKSLGLKIETEVIESKIVKNSQHNSKLNIDKKGKLFFLVRLRHIEDKPLIIEKTFLPLNLFKGIDKEDFSGSLYSILISKYNYKPEHSEGKFSIILAKENESNLLNVKLNSALMARDAVVYTEDSIPIEYCSLICRSDKFTFHFKSNLYEN